jgi:hypothetical protein
VAPSAGDVPAPLGTPVIGYNKYRCTELADDPFIDSPAEARWASLQHIDPNNPAVSDKAGYNDWRVYLMVARSGLNYSWPSKSILTRR